MELNSYPSEWLTTSLGKLARYINGRAFKPEDWKKSGLPIIRIQQMSSPNAPCDYYDGRVGEQFYINTGDLLFSWSATLMTMIWDRGPAILNQHIFKVEPEDGISKDFLYHLLDYLLVRLTAETHGSTMQHIRRPYLNTFGVTVPQKDEQCLIAAILNTVDNDIRSTEQLIAKLKQLRLGLLHDLLTYGIDDNGDLRDPLHHPEQFKPSADGLIPCEWEREKFGSVCSVIRDGTHLPPKRVEEGPLLLSVQNMIDGELQLTDRDTRVSWQFYNNMHQNWTIQPGDALLAIVGATIGKTAIVPDEMPPFTLQRSVAILRGKKELLDTQFLQHYLTTPEFRILLWRKVNQTAQPGIYLAELAQITLHVPNDIAEQKRINEVLAAQDSRIKAEQRQLAKLRLLKQGLIDNLLTGKVRVTALLAHED